jgi:hypothetical protein
MRCDVNNAESQRTVMVYYICVIKIYSSLNVFGYLLCNTDGGKHSNMSSITAKQNGFLTIRDIKASGEKIGGRARWRFGA